jgi:phosphoglycerate dehydrogenase-like enzyme
MEPLSSSSPLGDEPRVLITAHSSGLTPHSFARYRSLLIETGCASHAATLS